MPGTKELEQFTTELHKLANEPAVMAKWGEKHEPIPLPKDAPVPDIDVDDLLGSIPSSAGGEESPSMDSGTDDSPSILQGAESGAGAKDSGFADFDLPEFSADGSGDGFLSGLGDLPEVSDNADFKTSDFDVPGLTGDAASVQPSEAPQGSNTKEADFLGDISTLKSENGEPQAAEPDPLFSETEIENAANAKYDDMMAASPEDPLPDLPDSEVSLFTEPLDEPDENAGELKTAQSKKAANAKDTFEDILSGIDLDEDPGQSSGGNIENAQDIDTEALAVPEDLLTDIDPIVENTDDGITDIPDFSMDKTGMELPEIPDAPQSGKMAQNIETVGSVEQLPESKASAEDFSFDMPDLDDIGDSAQNESGTNGVNSAQAGVPDIETIDSAEFPEMPAAADFKDADLAGGASLSDDLAGLEDGGLELPSEEMPELAGEKGGSEAINEPIGFDLTPENEREDALSADRAMSEGIDLSDTGGTAVDTASPPEFTLNDGEMPDFDEHTAFAIDDDNVLNTEMGSGMDEFSIPESFTQFSPDKSFKIADKKKGADDEDYDGKIPLSISEADYDKLITRINSFPLNVRLEIEDYLVNGDDSELNKMEIVHLIVTDVSLKKIAAKLEGILDKPIQIPKGFDKKSYEEYEKQKNTFKYRFMHKILPVAILTAIIAGLAFCLTILGWQFIYKPAVAEGIYRDGFSAIAGGQYESALKRFDEAGAYTKKRRWYFTYAKAFREKKQFLSAEAVYKRLLFDFRHDKEGGIAYADMLSKDLRNYEKAEEVLRRDVLDHHINDEDALLALGDVYLDWADEQNEKYEEAKKIFVSLINTHGEKDSFLNGMLKYFIRTDNLAEVLPLKDRFLEKGLNGEDLAELSGYLLEKRYEPKPSDSDKLRESIEDVRELLEKSLKQTPDNPEANYNMARFFIYNRKNEAAEQYLEKAIGLYENSGKMTPKRLLRQLDSMRLYGELLSGSKRYNEALETFANALSKYGDYTAQKLIYPSKTVGKLYEDYGDILYFISRNAADDYDYDAALDAYENAVKELNDTPSVQYKMGYIHYKKENYIEAIKAMTIAYSDKPTDKNLLFGFGNVLFKRGNYFASQTYYERLMELLDAEKIRKGIIFPQSRPDHAAFVEDYMHASNNLGVVLNRLAVQNGDSKKNGRAISLLGESSRAWDALSRNQETMIRAKPVNLAYANIQNIIKPRSLFEPEIYSDIPKTLENEKILQQLEDR